MNILKSTMAVTAALVLGAGAAKATLVTYNWVPDTTLPNPVNGVTSSGTLVYNTTSQTISSFSFTYGDTGTETIYWADFYNGTVVLHDGDLALNGYSTDSNFNPIINWTATGWAAPDENSASASWCSSIYGDWVQAQGVTGNGNPAPVPEPTTVMSGALLLLPLGISIARVIRKERAAKG